MQTEKIFHYTSIESLAMILSTGRLRFARLDTVDDITEARTHSGIPFGKYFFVSCWTQEEDDNIAQWKMYGGDMEGIRIEFPAYPFKDARLEPHGSMKAQGDMYGPIPTSEWFGHNYMIIPPVVGNTTFAGPVDYVDDVAERYNRAIKYGKGSNGQDTLSIDKLYDLPRLKSRVWGFQSEYRFVLYAMPIDPPFPPGHPIEVTPNHFNNISQAFFNGADPGATFIDVPFDPAALDQMVIRTGPLCTAGGEVCVKALRDKFAPNAKIESSPLQKQIRRKW